MLLMQFINTESFRALDKREKHIKSSFLRLIISKHQKIAICCENEVYQDIEGTSCKY